MKVGGGEKRRKGDQRKRGRGAEIYRQIIDRGIYIWREYLSMMLDKPPDKPNKPNHKSDKRSKQKNNQVLK